MVLLICKLRLFWECRDEKKLVIVCCTLVKVLSTWRVIFRPLTQVGEEVCIACAVPRDASVHSVTSVRVSARVQIIM